MDIKDILTSIRQSKGYSKRTVSEMTGIPYTTYVKYESGERKDVSMYALCKLADFYGITTDYLLGREPLPDPFADLNLHDEEEKDVIDKYMSLPPETRAIILDVIRQLGGVMIDANKHKQPETVTLTCGELEDMMKAEQDAEKGAG